MNAVLFNFEFWSVFSCFLKSQELLMGSALVKLKDGSTEMLVSAAGKKGYVSSRIRENDKVIKNKVLYVDNVNTFNCAEQTMMREVNKLKVDIIYIGTTCDMCPACQAVAREMV